MPWMAVGKSSKRNGDGSLTVTAELQRDGARLRDCTVTAANIQLVRDGFDAELQQLRDAERDRVLNEVVAGQVLASVN